MWHKREAGAEIVLKYAGLSLLLVTVVLIAREFTTTTLEQAQDSFLSGDLAAALNSLRQVDSHDSTREITVYNMGLISALLGDTSIAKLYYHRAKNLATTGGMPSFRLGEIALCEGDTVGAAALFKEAVEYDDENLIAKAMLCLALAGTEKFDVADELVEPVLEEASGRSRIWLSIVQALIRMGKHDEALRRVKQSVYQFPFREVLAAGIELSLSLGDTAAASNFIRESVDLYDWNEYEWLTDWNSSSLNKLETETWHDGSDPPVNWFPLGRRFYYKARWGFIRLGTLIIEVKRPVEFHGKTCIPLKYRLTSNRHLLLIHVDDTYETMLSANAFQSNRHRMDVDETWWKYERNYEMDVESMKMQVYTINKDGRMDYLEKYTPQNLMDGATILYYTSALVRSRRGGMIPTLVNYDYVWTEVDFTGKTETLAVQNEERNAWIIEGDARFMGIAGLSGGFKGWFEDSNSAIPLRGALEIFVGSIVLELEREEPIE